MPVSDFNKFWDFVTMHKLEACLILSKSSQSKWKAMHIMIWKKDPFKDTGLDKRVIQHVQTIINDDDGDKADDDEEENNNKRKLHYMENFSLPLGCSSG